MLKNVPSSKKGYLRLVPWLLITCNTSLGNLAAGTKETLHGEKIQTHFFKWVLPEYVLWLTQENLCKDEEKQHITHQYHDSKMLFFNVLRLQVFQRLRSGLTCLLILSVQVELNNTLIFLTCREYTFQRNRSDIKIFHPLKNKL